MTTTFKTANHEFTLALNYTKARQIRESLSLDFVDMAGMCQVFARLDLDTDLLMKVLYAFVEPQCKAAGLDEAAFGEGFTDGEAFESARAALAECAINFFSPRTREELRRALEIQTAQLKEMLASKVEKMNTSTGG